MAADTQKPDAEPGAPAPAPEPEPDRARAGPPILQQVLVASLVAAIILMIAIAAFWTTL